MNDAAIQARVRELTDAKMRDHNKAQAEKHIFIAIDRLKRAHSLLIEAECPKLADTVLVALGSLSWAQEGGTK